MLPCATLFHDPVSGLRFDWAEAQLPQPAAWLPPRADGLHICLNWLGIGRVSRRQRSIVFLPGTAGFFWHGLRDQTSTGRAPGHHRLAQIHVPRAFLEELLEETGAACGQLRAVVRDVVRNRIPRVAGAVGPMSPELLRAAESFRHPPVPAVCRALWFRARTLELVAELLFERDPPESESRDAAPRERTIVDQVRAQLERNFADPPSLTELAASTGVSPFALSRAFARIAGRSMPAYLRNVRMERAAALLRSGNHNVTEAAFAVGYQSLGHFGQAFRARWGCSPRCFRLKASELRER